MATKRPAVSPPDEVKAADTGDGARGRYSLPPSTGLTPRLPAGRKVILRTLPDPTQPLDAIPPELREDPLKIEIDNRLARLAQLPADTLQAAPGITLKPKGDAQDWERTWSRSLPFLPVAGLLDEEEEPTVEQGDLELLEVLGEGGMGIVHRARQHSLQRDVAIKKIKNPRAQSDLDTRVQAMLHEARCNGTLEHPNIVPVHALGVDGDDLPVLVMKRVEGVSWLTMVQEPEHEAWQEVNEPPLVWHLRVLMQVCNAAQFAHSRGIIHRDIKPENVMVGAYGEVYLMDWGVAYDTNLPSKNQVIVGTPSYMAPEMALQGALEISARTDVYLLGSCLHEVLTGVPPHDAETVNEALRKAAHNRPLTYPDQTPDELIIICRQAMATHPDQRFQSAQAMRRALEIFLTHRESVRLSDAAAQQFALMKAEPDADLVQLQRLFSACLFGVEQALDLWKHNPKALDLRRDAAVWMAHVALERRDLNLVDRVLADMASVPTSMQQDRQRLQEALNAQSQASVQLQNIERQHDLRVYRKQRAIQAVALGITMTIGMSTLAALDGWEIYSPSHAVHVALLTLMTMGFGVGLAVVRRTVLSTVLNRKLMMALGIMCVGLIVAALFTWLAGVPVATAFAVSYLIAGIGTAISMSMGERGMFSVALCFTLGAFATLLWPLWYLWIGTGALLTGHVLAVIVWWLSGDDAPVETSDAIPGKRGPG